MYSPPLFIGRSVLRYRGIVSLLSAACRAARRRGKYGRWSELPRAAVVVGWGEWGIMRKIGLILAVALLALAEHAAARISPADYSKVGVTLPSNAALPLTAFVTDLDGRQRHLADF